MSSKSTADAQAGSIYFVTVSLVAQVYVMGGIGFTDYLNLFCWGETPEAAEETARAHLMGANVAVKKVLGKTSLAISQDPTAYTFPEQICGLPDQLAVKAIHRQNYPSDWIAETLKTLRKRQAQLSAGRRLLDTQKALERAQAPS